MRYSIAAILWASAVPAWGQYFSVPAADAPELAARGRYGVGVRTIEIVHHNQPDILRFDKETGKAPLADRALTVEIWYPAVIPAGAEERVVYEMAMPGNPQPGDASPTFKVPGKALRDAAPLGGQTFPLVVVSHGYPGSRVFLSWLTENLASKGYVVASIDHTDSVTGAQRPFTSTLLNRSADQTFTMDAITALAADGKNFLHGVVDPTRVAIVGYSMGGYGALATAGAGYSKDGGSTRTVPGGYFDGWTAGSAAYQAIPRTRIKAMVAIAPWGSQPPNNNWDAEGLKGIRAPSLFIMGDHDDVSGYDAMRKTFESTANSDRYLLVYENARHNVGGNPPPPEAMASFSTRAFFDEPVWRKERITAINQHFITAFLDLYVKGDEARREYLSLPAKAPDRNTVWKGFQPRWSLGLEWQHRTPTP